MKSEKAKKCIDANVNYHREIAKPFIGLEYAIHAIEFSENEMQEKAIEAFKSFCSNNTKCEFFDIEEYLCEKKECKKYMYFINRLNNK